MISILFILCLAFPPQAQLELPTLDDGGERDTALYADTAGATRPQQDTAAVADYVQSARGPKKPKIIRRNYNYREQLGLALGMMAFVAVIFTTVQNWNPD